MLTAEVKKCHWRQNNRERATLAEKKSSIKRKYGLSWDDYVDLYNKQEGRCAICSAFMELLPKKKCPISTCIDHNHITGKVRGLLCRPCNLAIGNFRENINSMKAAIKYLENA